MKDFPVIVSLPTLEELRKYVLEELCLLDRLDPGQTPLYQGLVTRQGRPCGLFFQVQGPRQVKAYALWAGEENRIFFYDSKGLRLAEKKLSDGPDPLKLAS
jgi:hypothetical protein